MKAVLVSLSHTGARVQFHAFVAATILTGGFMLLTASDLGALAPLVISLGLYAIVFGLVAEAFLGCRLLISDLAIRLLDRRIEKRLGLFGDMQARPASDPLRELTDL